MRGPLGGRPCGPGHRVQLIWNQGLGLGSRMGFHDGLQRPWRVPELEKGELDKREAKSQPEPRG